jgi:uncharacterized protein YggE
MQRILMVLTVALVMAAMVVATAMPAFAVPNCEANPDHPNCVLTGPGESETTPAAGGGNPNIVEEFDNPSPNN